MSTRKQSNHLVNLINTFLFNDTIRTFLIGKDIPIEENERLTTFGEFGVAVCKKDGKHYLINTEGVGSGTALEDKPEEIYFYKEMLNEKGRVIAFDTVPFVKITATKDELDIVMSGETKPLNEFVRSFGDRLDSNFYIWEKFLTVGE